MGKEHHHTRSTKPISQALIAAALFGSSVPLVKPLVAEIRPVPLAALLYLGSGIGAVTLLALRRPRARGRAPASQATLTWTDLPYLAAGVLSGGIAAPIVLLIGLRSTPSATASMLLNFEALATALLAALLFHESIGRRVWTAVVLIVLASVFLSVKPDEPWGVSPGALGVIAACTLWGLDSNLTRKVSGKDPLAIVAVKGLGAGLFSLVLAMLLGLPVPSLQIVAVVMVLGFASYGLSIALFVGALRELGAARTAALFGTAPFFGAALSFVVTPVLPGPMLLLSAPLMAAGVACLFGEAHQHEHQHPELLHDHRHSHDDGHHTHVHAPWEIGPSGYHAHAHRHTATAHAHPHTPDLHHQHDHPGG